MMDKIGENERGLNKDFLKELFNGDLQWVLQTVNNKKDIVLAIRHNYIDLYYEDGRLLNIVQGKKYINGGLYGFYFNPAYIDKEDEKKEFVSTVIGQKRISEFWKKRVAKFIKWSEKHYKDKKVKQIERYNERQIMKCNEDNKEFCILDMEYAVPKEMVACKPEIDMIAISSDNKLVLIEYKNGEKAIGNKQSLSKHHTDFVNILKSNAIDSIKQSAFNMLQNKKGLEIINKNHYKKIKTIDDIKSIEILYLLSNCKEDSTVLQNEIGKIKKQGCSTSCKIMFLEEADYSISLKKYEEAKNIFEGK